MNGKEQDDAWLQEQRDKMARLVWRQETRELIKKGVEARDRKDYAEAVACFNKAAEMGNADAQNKLGNCYYKGEGVPQDYAKAAGFERAAEHGHAEAQYQIGKCYSGTDMGVTQDKAKSVFWYTKASEQGNAEAQFNIGYCYYNGEGVPQNYAKAAYWYAKAAEQGNQFAQRSLGGCYERGEGVPRDKAKAVYWYTKAAEQGDVENRHFALEALKRLRT